MAKSAIDCGTTQYLAVHHKVYSKNKMPWEYPIENFQVLCEGCHSKEHSIEYQQNNCASCKAVISTNFVYCIKCHNEQVKRLENQNKNYEDQIQNLNKKLSVETAKGKNEDSREILSLRAELNQLNSQKSKIESILNEYTGQVKKLKHQNAEYANRIQNYEDQIQNLNKKLSVETAKGKNEDSREILSLRAELNQLNSEKSKIESYSKRTYRTSNKTKAPEC
jgi:chromosome segregation ATPase